MAISEFPNAIENSLWSHSEFALNNRSPVKLRGSNFKNTAYIYSNSITDEKWLWKNVNTTSMIKEFLASYLASKLGVNVPRSMLAKKGTQIGLLCEWLDESVELKDTASSVLRKFPPKDVINLLLLEAWIGGSDRHSGNYLCANDNLWAIDFERSFKTEPLDSELLLHFEWMQKSKNQIKEELDLFKKLIMQKNVLQDESKVLNLIDDRPIDSRAKAALKIQVSIIFTSLQTNFEDLDARIEKYFQGPVVSLLF
ncbi:hypothetical protein CEE45_08710 [Candidatus Heimdallarchaeota archaeon B3_Heim]|nr:MAG: hypothetical protein CEE45_08710 [Candidatus Heimdallarchaeota archaeon B3_Heim]